MSIPDDMSEHDIERHYTFTSEDLEFINKHRRNHNRLGIAKTFLIQFSIILPNKLMSHPKNIHIMRNESQLEMST